MPRSKKPHEPHEGKSWCSKHNDGEGAFRPIEEFPLVKGQPFSYCRDCKKEYQAKWDRRERKENQTTDLHLEVVELLGGVCAKCGIMDTRVLVVEPNDKLRMVKENPEEYELLCRNDLFLLTIDS